MPNTGTMLVGSATVPGAQPLGSQSYCATSPNPAAQAFWDSFCHADNAPATAVLTEQHWKDLVEAQREAYRAFIYGPTLSWDPLAPIGDCKTYAAEVNLLLLEHGWPAGAMRIATAFVNDHGSQQWAYHAALLIDTDKGTIVLDDRHQAPVPWQELPYIWMTAELPGEHGAWAVLPSNKGELQMAVMANLTAGRGRSQVAALPTP